MAAPELIPFGHHLQELLDKHDPPLSQAVLATKTGLDRSLISRIIRGDRKPTNDALQYIGGFLRIPVDELVRGTDAEGRVESASPMVPRELLEAALRERNEWESRATEFKNLAEATEERLKAEVRRRETAEISAGEIHYQRELKERDLSAAKRTIQELDSQLKKHKMGLELAVAELATVRAQLRELAEELSSTKKSSRTAAILSAISAVTGAATVAYFLSRSDSPGEKVHSDQSRSERKKRSENKEE